MKFDAERIAAFLKTGKISFPMRDELEEYYFRLDTEGTGVGMLAILDEDIPDAETRLQSAMLSKAVRIYYDLRDLKKETLQGLVNIPYEDAVQFGICLSDLEAFAKSKKTFAQAPESIKSWICVQVAEGLDLLESSKPLWGENSAYKPHTRHMLKTNYHASAQVFLENLQGALNVGNALPSNLPVGELNVQEPWRSVEAVFESRSLCRKYTAELGITDKELKKYFGKARNLALMYVGFSQKGITKESLGAGRAAFLSCAYDVCSDWRSNPAEFRPVLEKILEQESSPSLTQKALDLFDKDINGVLETDGLERGVVALEFIVEMMEIRNQLETGFGMSIGKLGILFQIVDDVLDIEEDIENGDENCLLSSNKDHYLDFLIQNFNEEQLNQIFTHSSLLKVLIGKAVKKATDLQAP